jgi:hypothetical protein
MSTAALTFHQLDTLTHGRLGAFDVPCPQCGPERRLPTNRRRHVLRVWRIDPSFATFHCARCGEKGYARDGSGPKPDPVKLAKARAEAAKRERAAVIERLGKARWLWSCRRPLAGSLAEVYLREARGCGGTLPATLGFLPARGEHGPALIAAFGLPAEPEPGVLAIANTAVLGVHLTRLAPDGSGKAGSDADKIAVGRSLGSPIVLAPANDLLALAVTEGIEDGLSVHAATGLGVWCAGSASRMAALADTVPTYVETVTIFVDGDEDGQRGANELAGALLERAAATRIETPEREWALYFENLKALGTEPTHKRSMPWPLEVLMKRA